MKTQKRIVKDLVRGTVMEFKKSSKLYSRELTNNWDYGYHQFVVEGLLDYILTQVSLADLAEYREARI